MLIRIVYSVRIDYVVQVCEVYSAKADHLVLARRGGIPEPCAIIVPDLIHPRSRLIARLPYAAVRCLL